MYGPPGFQDHSTAPLSNWDARSYMNQSVQPDQMELHVNPAANNENTEGENGRTWATQRERGTAELIKELPSHRPEELASKAGADNHLRDRKSRRSKYATLSHIPKDLDVEDILTAMANEAGDSDADLEDDVQLNTVLRETTAATLSYKKQLRRKMTSKRKARHVSWWKHQKYSISLRWIHFRYKMAEVTYYLKLWKGHMKKIEGHFGTGVVSYFRFLKWLFLLNIPVFFVTLAFVIIPQALFRYRLQEPPGYVNNTIFFGTDILTGGGWFQATEMYYGYYINQNITLVEGHRYNMPYAYLLTCGAYYLLCLIILAYSMSKSYRENYIDGSGELGLYMATKVFGGWDCGITSLDAAELKHRSLFNEFQEYLSGFAPSQVRSLSDRFKWFFLRLLSNLIVLGLIAGAAYLVYYLSQSEQLENDIPFLSDMALPLTISAMLVIIPFAFSVIGNLERYVVPKTELYFTMVRTMLLKAVILGVLVYFWFNQLPCHKPIGNETIRSLTEMEKGTCEPCWETAMGERIYRLVLVDFVFVLGFTFLVEFVRRLMAQYCCKRLAYPEFNIGRNTLNLIYSQTLCWLGTFYCPFLSLITIVKLFIMFYVKRVSVMQNCRPSLKPWRASRTHTIFLGFLFCFFLLAAISVACSIIFIEPSEDCGPYRGKSKAYDVIIELIDYWETKERIIADIIDFITSPGFVAGIIVVLCVGTYYLHIIMIGHKEMVALLKHQLVLEGKDKTYLLDMLQMINRQIKTEGTLVGTSPRRSQHGPEQGTSWQGAPRGQ
ncbi:transmembrane channel-like protein 5 isoform X2 [Liolophura sinensis]|uniref:transmembrane channel-like protein 5 isoform X2 n=1 Tax=Liolophura sinensis TaxID=3198878 RepID=UPI0031597DE5